MRISVFMGLRWGLLGDTQVLMVCSFVCVVFYSFGNRRGLINTVRSRERGEITCAYKSHTKGNATFSAYN
jgi:hypothetical protein